MLLGLICEAGELPELCGGEASVRAFEYGFAFVPL